MTTSSTGASASGHSRGASRDRAGDLAELDAASFRHGPSILQSVLRYKLAVIAATVLGGIGGYVLGNLESTRYDATARMLLADPREQDIFTNNRQVSLDRYLLQQAEQLRSAAVLGRVVSVLGEGTSVQGLRARIEVQADPNVMELTVTAPGATAIKAAERANAVAQAYQDVTRERAGAKAQTVIDELSASIADLSERIDATTAELEASRRTGPNGEIIDDPVFAGRLSSLVTQVLQLEAASVQAALEAKIAGSGVELYEEALPPENPAAPKPLASAILLAILAGGAAVAAAYWRAGKAERAETSSDVREVLGVPSLGSVPVAIRPTPEGLADALREQQGAAEAYQFVLASMSYALLQNDSRMVLITGAESNVGKTMSCIHLAHAAARDGQEVALVDADLRTRALSKLLSMETKPGLRDMAANDGDLSTPVHRQWVGEHRVPIVPTGRLASDAASFLRTTGFQRAMSKIRENFPLVLIDSAPLLEVPDPWVIAGNVDAIVLILHAGMHRDQLEKIRDRLRFVPAPVIGFISVSNEPREPSSYGIDGHRLPSSPRFGRAAKKNVL